MKYVRRWLSVLPTYKWCRIISDNPNDPSYYRHSSAVLLCEFNGTVGDSFNNSSVYSIELRFNIQSITKVAKWEI